MKCLIMKSYWLQENNARCIYLYHIMYSINRLRGVFYEYFRHTILLDYLTHDFEKKQKTFYYNSKSL